jgi:hypothetical protein
MPSHWPAPSAPPFLGSAWGRRRADQPVAPTHTLYTAQTAQAAAHGNFSLDLGLGAHSVEQHSFGISPVNTIQRLCEHLTVLTSIQADGAVKFHGQEIYVAVMGTTGATGHR